MSTSQSTSRPPPTPQRHAVRRAYLLLAAVVILWGVNWPIMKIGLAFIEPVWFVALRMFIGAGLFFAWQLATSGVAVPGRRDMPIILSIGSHLPFIGHVGPVDG